MTKRFSFFLLLLPFILSAQKQQITLEEIWNGAFREQYLESYQPMKGDLYSLLNYNRDTKSTSIDIYDYATLEKKALLLDSKNLIDIPYFDSYLFNETETHILISTQSASIYRRSKKAIYYLYEINTKNISKIDEAFIQEPRFSKDSKKIAYIKTNNLFVKTIETNEIQQVTSDGLANNIINGITDWVYEEEFAFVKAYEWSLDSKKIAFLKFNETEVPSYSMDVTGQELYPTSNRFKYPKAGEKNAEVSLHIADLNTNSIQKISLGDFEYIPFLKWTHKNNKIAVVTLNRHQNNLNLFTVDTKSNTTTLLLEEKDSRYIDVEKISELTFLNDNSFIWQSEKSGFNHLYHYSSDGKLKNQMTKGKWEVTNFYGIDLKEKTLFYQSVEDGSINKTIYKIDLDGKNKKRISKATGTSNADFSKEKNFAIINHSDSNTPTTYNLYSSKKLSKEILNNNSLLEKLDNYSYSKKEFSEITTKEGVFNMWTLKPANFDSLKKYPLLIVQYSGPGSQRVSNSWNNYNDYWFQMLAQKGYVIACIDVRGTGYKGADFKKSTYKELGKYETIDLIAATKKLRNLPYIETNAIGIWGWSYGGFMATNCLLKGNDVFDTAIAVAPVTSWEYYDTIYTERHMQTPQENPEGYQNNSPLFFADQLKGNYLIVHGSSDDNVHLQNTYQMSNALIQANKPFEQAIYPDRTHSIYRGKNTRLHLYTKMTNYLDTHLKNQQN
jgi:dipeptidyl-peptidase-4